MRKFWQNETIPYYRNKIEDLSSGYDKEIESHIYLPSQDSLKILSNTPEFTQASLRTIIPSTDVASWLINNMPDFSKSLSTYYVEIYPVSGSFYIKLTDTPEKIISFLIQKNLLIFTEYETVYESFQAEYSHDIYLKKDPALRDLQFVRIEPEEEQA